jgi:hypothetical protein
MSLSRHTDKEGNVLAIGDAVEFVFGGDPLTGEVVRVGNWTKPGGERVQLAIDTTVEMPTALVRRVSAASEPSQNLALPDGSRSQDEARPAATTTSRKSAQRGQKERT